MDSNELLALYTAAMQGVIYQDGKTDTTVYRDGNPIGTVSPNGEFLWSHSETTELFSNFDRALEDLAFVTFTDNGA